VSTERSLFEPGFDIRAQRRQRRRRFLRVAGPIAIVLVMITALASIGAYLYRANRDDARALSGDLLEALDQRIATEVRAYLQPASTMIELVRDVVERDLVTEQSLVLAEPVALSILRNYPQLANFLFADPQGNFMMLKKQPDGAIDTKHIDRSGGAPHVTWVRRDPEGNVTGTELDPEDTYDPRVRPWYRGAARTGELYWSDVYIFFTDREPGVTAALPVFEDDGELTSVFGVDIELQALSRFIGGLEIGTRGRALIVDRDGTIVAYPGRAPTTPDQDGALAPPRIDDLDDPVLARAFDRFRVEGHGSRDLEIDGVRYMSTVSRLAATPGQEWSVLIVVPENDFVGFVVKNNRTGLAMSVVVIGLASVLAALLAAQSLRADRNARLVLARQHQLDAQSRAFSELAVQVSSFEQGDDSSLAALTETVSATLGARRVSVWRLHRQPARLVCEDCYDRDTAGHTQGTELEREEIPELFAALAAGEEVFAADATNAQTARSLYRIYLHPMGCRALISMPIVQDNEAVGALWLEDEAPPLAAASEGLDFCRAIANLLALRHVVASEHASAPTPGRTPRQQEDAGEAAARPLGPAGRDLSVSVPPAPLELPAPMRNTSLSVSATAGGARARAFMARLAREERSGRGVRAQVLEEVSVLALRMTDPLALAEAADDEASVLERLALELEQTGSRHGVEYLKVLGERVTCAHGAEEGMHGTHAMADFALEVQGLLRGICTRLDRPLAFGIGIDSGPAMAAVLGRDGGVFNLWGDAVDAAARMADSAQAGGIQVTESAYQRLRDDYLFRVRGRYYMEELGEITTYVLAGRV